MQQIHLHFDEGKIVSLLKRIQSSPAPVVKVGRARHGHLSHWNGLRPMPHPSVVEPFDVFVFRLPRMPVAARLSLKEHSVKFPPMPLSICHAIIWMFAQGRRHRGDNPLGKSSKHAVQTARRRRVPSARCAVFITGRMSDVFCATRNDDGAGMPTLTAGTATIKNIRTFSR